MITNLLWTLQLLTNLARILEPRFSKLVINCSLLGVRKDLVSLLYPPELLARQFLMILISLLIRM